MANHGFGEFPNIIKHYTTIVTSTLLKEGYTMIENHTILKDIKNFVYLTQLYFMEDIPNQILHMLSTLVLLSKHFLTTIGQYPTLYDFLAIAPKEISHWEYYLTYPNKCVKLNIFFPTLLPPSLYSGEMLHHMPDSGESLHVSVRHTINNMTSPSICQSHDLSVCQPKCDSTWNSIHP